jgi:PilZ domain
MLPRLLTPDAPDRRRRPRLKLAYPLRLRHTGTGSWIKAITEDISCEGFFCITEPVFSPREKLHCALLIPSDGDGQPDEETIILRCQAEIVRVVRRGNTSFFGIGCRLWDYEIEREVADPYLVLDAVPEIA